ncbi:MAG: hypothetical protein GWM90_01070, partial [Gemmatimonadetes bacterium]|nr:zf-HC2 domain-containing protein [Gemmatimonadota bacterium]NIQ52163.1 zf-HC2 domain-containing protein [Gemmatimonadota bacterium]NIU72266.1 hypothetical protein [Gammaproteobacteria bacterium]NIX42771.1 hypothetical protein [Gemmatimonadota bacterium]NIY06937.1 hypothetical protein [Gemmatimonadota bacterium]
MSHLEDGTVQAFLDDELPTEERAAAAEHLLACGQCRALRDELVRARSLFSEAVASLDVRPPGRARRADRHVRRVGAGSFVKAAGLVLLLAAAASAAVPGTPV